MNKARNEFDIMYDINRSFAYFNKEDLFSFVKWAVVNIHEDLRDGNIDKTNNLCSVSLQEKLTKNKEKYRLVNDVDRITIQYIDIYDCITKNDIPYIQVYVSIYFYDKVSNNEKQDSLKDKYFDDTWIVTLKEDEVLESQKKYRCTNCGAYMKLNKITEVFECKYCGNTMYDHPKTDWIIDDIEIK